jgi:hypothetical protein
LNSLKNIFSDKGIEEMTSLISQIKQVPANAGYYINVGNLSQSASDGAKFYMNLGTDELPNISTNIYATSSYTSTVMATAGAAIFKDMGKTLTSSGRVFRKVQMVATSTSVLFGGTDGVAGLATDPTAYLTGYIELPGQHGSGGFSAPTPVARLG